MEPYDYDREAGLWVPRRFTPRPVCSLFQVPLAYWGQKDLNTYSLDLEATNSEYAYITDADQDGALDPGTATLTIELWVKFETLPSGTSSMIFLSKYEVGVGGYYFRINATVGPTYFLSCACQTAGGLALLNSDNWVTPVTGTWYHVSAAVWDDGANQNCDFTVDGVQLGVTKTDADNGAIQGSTVDFRIGSTPAGGSYLDGKVDDVRLWNTHRAIADIAADRSHQLSGAESGLIFYTKCNNNVNDSTSHANNLSTSSTGGGPVYSTDVPFT